MGGVQDMAAEIGGGAGLSPLVLLVLGMAVALFLVGEVFRRWHGRSWFDLNSEPERH